MKRLFNVKSSRKWIRVQNSPNTVVSFTVGSPGCFRLSTLVLHLTLTWALTFGDFFPQTGREPLKEVAQFLFIPLLLFQRREGKHNSLTITNRLLIRPMRMMFPCRVFGTGFWGFTVREVVDLLALRKRLYSWRTLSHDKFLLCINQTRAATNWVA